MSSNESAALSGGVGVLEGLRTRAKDILKQARAGDSVVIARLRTLLPRLEPLDDTAVAESIVLADVQHAIARQNGKASWSELKNHIHSLDPIHIQAGRFLAAIRDNHVDRAKRLLDQFPRLRSHSAHTAAAACDAAELETLLQRNPTAATAPAATADDQPLIYLCQSTFFKSDEATRASSLRCAELLLDAGASPNASVALDDTEGRIAALYFACVSNNTGIVRLLLERGANPNDGESVYHSAEFDHRECLQLLVQYGADISGAHPQFHNTPLYFLAGYKPFSRSCASSERGMQWLLEHGADPNVSSLDDATGAERASRPLHRIAAYGKGVHVAAMLVEHGAEVNAPRGDGKTAYALAVRTGNVPVAAYLLEHGADSTNVAPVDDFIGACVRGGRDAALRLTAAHPGLLARMTVEDKHTLALAAEEDNQAAVRLMIDLGWDITAEGEWGGTALHHAAWHGRPEMTRLLLSLGAPVNFRDSSFGSSPLAWAAHGSVNGRAGHDDEYCEVVELLLDAGSTREASYNKWSESPESMSSKAVARLLRRRGFAPLTSDDGQA
ncbi:MAG: ankyrin repeat domain-containing protein [Gemmatimonadota bacterium]